MWLLAKLLFYMLGVQVDFIVDGMGKNCLTEEKGKETRVHKIFPSKREKNGLISPSLTQIDNLRAQNSYFLSLYLFPILIGPYIFMHN